MTRGRQELAEAPNGFPDPPASRRDAHTYESLRQSNEAIGNRYVIDDLIRPATVSIISGRSGTGKSPFCYQAAVCVAAGVPFLDLPTTQGAVYVFDYENGQMQIAQMCNALQRHLGLETVPPSLWLWTSNLGSDPIDIIRKEKPALAIIDSLSAWRPGCEEKNGTAASGMRELRDAAKATGCAIVVVHHLRKPSTDPRQSPEKLETGDVRQWLDQVRGASALINGADGRFGVEALCRHGGDIVVAGFARVDGTLPKLCLRRECDEHGEPLGYMRLVGASLLDAQDRAFLDKVPAEFTFRLAKYAHERGDQSTSNLLKRLVAAGVLRQEVPRGPYRKA
jgi:hypothetical protein